MPDEPQINTTEQARPLIVGAGPVGLAAALFLARQGVVAEVMDAAAGPSPQSRALAVNPRTLEILEPTGITTEMLAIGKRIRGVRITAGKKLIGEMSLSGLAHRFPFMLALSQGVTVRLLESQFNRLGGQIEWNQQVTGCRNVSSGVEAEVKSAPGGTVRTVRCPWVLAADGARSTVRAAMGIDFPGSSFEKPWYLTDIPLATSLPEDLAHVIWPRGGGFLFLIRVIDDPEKEARPDKIWRVIGNMPDPLSRLEAGKACGPPVWESLFHISHRISKEFQTGAVYFAGDAAHLHSPIGARGMNLGIEDAWVFSQLLKGGRLAEYGERRHAVDGRVVRRIEMVSRLVRGESIGSRVLRRAVFPTMIRLPFARTRFLKMASGLDHPLPDAGSDATAPAARDNGATGPLIRGRSSRR